MKAVISLMNRNRKLFFRDKGMFFSALITPFILIVLYATFLAKVYKDSFTSAFPEGFQCFTDKPLKDISWIFPCNSAEFIACKWAGTCDRTSLHRKNGLVFKLCGCALDYL